MKINVTQTYIDRGTPEVGDECPIALAVKDQTGYTNVNVHSEINHAIVITHWSDGESEEFVRMLPTAAREFIEKFDHRQPVEPFEFEIEDV
jgi:hypothetical protein